MFDFRFSGKAGTLRVAGDSEDQVRSKWGDMIGDLPLVDVREHVTPEWVRRARANALPLRDETNLRGYVL